MNDPFAMLNPIDKPKSAPVYGGPPASPVAPLHPVGGPGGFGAPGGMPGMGMGMGMGMAPPGMGMNMGMPTGGMGLNMGGGMSGGMGPGMGQGMGMAPPGMGPGMGAPGLGMGMGGGMPQQAPIMYDNIKNLLEQKPKPSGAMRDDAGMDFLESLGSGKANSLSVTSPTAAAVPAVDPFGGSALAAPAHVAAPMVSLAGFEFPGETSSSSTTTPTTVSPSGSGKSNALAERLANGRRKTQEAQRQQLGFNAGAFTTTSAPKISLKELAPQSSSSSSSKASSDRESRAPSLEDFASGKPVFQESDPFGMGMAVSSGGSSSRTNSGSSHSQSKHQPVPSSHHSSSSGGFDNSSEGGSFFADSDADFEKKLNSGSSSGSARQLSSGNLGASRTGSGSAAAKATMDFGW